MPRPRVGVSACLLGQRVRYDGDHKRDAFVSEELARLVDLVPVCPEVEVGMGVPRDTLRLVQAGALVRLVAPRTGRDFTADMEAWAEARTRALAAENLSGYVLKRNSPSCGLVGVSLFASVEAELPASQAGVGLFAAALRGRFPDLPIEEEGRLGDRAVRESFVARVLAYGAEGRARKNG
jgi:uncharacterized protein YbbK (DUF523 family)